MPDLAFERELTVFIEQAAKLTSLPTVAVDLLRIARAEDASSEQLSAVLLNDSGLSARLLRAANSRLFQGPQETRTLRDAIESLGLPSAKWMSLALCLAERIPAEGSDFDFHGYWLRSVVATVAGRALGRIAGQEPTDDTMVSLVAQVVCDEKKSEPYGKLAELFHRRYQLTEHDLGTFLADLEPEIREASEVLSFPVPDGLDLRAIVELARFQSGGVSVGKELDRHVAERHPDDRSVRSRRLQDKSTMDSASGLPNRVAFDEALAREIEARMEGTLPRCLGLLRIELDRFGRLCEEHSDELGKALLNAVGDVLFRCTRKGDLAARIGDADFAVLLPATTPALLKTVADRIRGAVEAEAVTFGGKDWRMTASSGGACLEVAQSEKDAEGLIRVAESYLTKAKENGRNRCEVYSQSELPGR
ncbi:MAG: diguanylate cyclase [Planctomycetota bacterium]